MSSIGATELCQKLKSEATARQDASAVNNLRLRILDYFITRNVPDDMFEGILKAHLNDPDPPRSRARLSVPRFYRHGRPDVKRIYEGVNTDEGHDVLA